MANVLIVDDHPDIGRILVRIAQRIGHSAEYVTSGEAALSRLSKDLPNLVILDVMMPGIDGFEVLRTLRSEGRTATLPVVMYSAMSDNEVIQRAMSQGATGYWVKGSFDVDSLQHNISELLGPVH